MKAGALSRRRDADAVALDSEEDSAPLPESALELFREPFRDVDASADAEEIGAGCDDADEAPSLGDELGELAMEVEADDEMDAGTEVEEAAAGGCEEDVFSFCLAAAAEADAAAEAATMAAAVVALGDGAGRSLISFSSRFFSACNVASSRSTARRAPRSISSS